MDSIDFMRRLISDLKEKRRMSQAEIAKALGVSPSGLSGYIAGYDSSSKRRAPRPNGDVMMKAIALLGGNIEHAFPTDLMGIAEDSVPFGDVDLHIRGRVGASTPGIGFECVEDIGLKQLFLKSPKSRFCRGDVFFHWVEGDSMSPVYTDGTLLPCRAPKDDLDPHQLPDNTPVIFREKHDGSYTFKLLQSQSKRGKSIILGVPINVTHRPILWTPSEVEIYAIVLGRIETGDNLAAVSRNPKLAPKLLLDPVSDDEQNLKDVEV